MSRARCKGDLEGEIGGFKQESSTFLCLHMEVVKDKAYRIYLLENGPRRNWRKAHMRVVARVRGFTQEEEHLFLNLHHNKENHLIVLPMGLGTGYF